MTTTSIHPGHSVSGILNNCEWGEGYTASERNTLDRALVEKFEELAREKTGDNSITYYPYTSEIQYECWGTRTGEHGPLAPKTAWTIGDDEEVEWGELAREAGEWVAENIEEIIGETELNQK